MNSHYLATAAALIICLAAGCTTTPTATSAARGRLLISGNDGKLPMIDGVYKVANPAVPDTLTVLDVSTFPPKRSPKSRFNIR